MSGGLFVGSIGGKFVQQRFTFNGGAGWTYSTGAQAPSSLSTQRLVSPYLEFSGSPQTLLSGQCSAAVTVQTRNAQNGVATTGGLVTLASSDGTIQFYSAPGCGGSPVASITIPAGSSSAGFYFKGTTAGAPEITASVAGFAYASQNATINVPKLAFTTPAVTATAGACSAAFATIQSQSPNGSPLNVQANTPVSLTSSDGTMQFYTTSGCGGSAVASITISAGSSSANFYLRSTTAGTPLITASAAGYANATQGATITADTTPPSTVLDLAALGISETQARLTWTSPGDDGSAGSITNGQYDIRWAQVDSGQFDYNTATPVLLPATGPSGQSKSVTIDGLPTGMTVSFGLKTADTAGNVSERSNIASAPTFTVRESLDTVVRMAAPIPVSIVLADQNSSASVLQIAFDGGLSPASSVYELTPSPYTFSSPARVTFKFNPATVDVATLAIYKADTPTSPLSSVPITNQTIDLVANTISGDVSGLSFFVLLFKTQDALPPRSVIDIGLPSFSASPVLITSTTRLSITATDDLQVVGDGRGSGVAQTRYAIDAAAFAPFLSSFTIVGSGLHTIRFFSTDLAGNTEAERTSTVAVDNTAPATALAAVGGKQASGPDAASFFASSDTRISLSATDPLVSGVASGLALTHYQDNTGPLQTYSAPFLLTQGSHTLNYHSRDNLGNAEVAQSSTILIDAAAPVSTASVGSPLYVSAAGVRFISPATPVSLTAIDPTVANVASGVERLEVSVDGGAFVTYASALTFAEGRHVLLFRAVDRVGNRETENTLELQVDATSPLTARGLSGGFEFTDAGGDLFVSSGARLAFTAADPVPALPGALASGVAFTQYRLDAAPTAPFTAFVSPLAPLSEGRHAVEFRSQDNVGNLETTRTLAITYDATAPVITITAPGAGSYVATKNTIPVSFTVTDNFDPTPVMSAVLTQIQDRGSPRGARPAVVAVASGQALQPLSLDDGLWQLRVSATDFVQNAAAAAGDTFEVVHDTLAPRSTLAVGAPQASGGPGGSLFVTRDTLFTLSSIDDLVNSNDAAGLGVSFQELNVDAILRGRFTNPAPASGQIFTSTFTLGADADGARALSFYAEDALQNREAARPAAVAVDNTAPLTTLAAEGGRQYPAPDAATFYASLATRISLASVDPLVNGVASGVELTQYQENGGAFQTFTTPLSLPEGSHALVYRSRDRVQNLEVMRSSTVLVDATAPTTAAGVGAPLFVAADGARYVTPASTVTFSAADPALPGGQAGSGVSRVELSLDGAAFAAVNSALALAEGRHELLYRAVDNVGNTEAARSLELRSDTTPPSTMVQLGAPLFTAADGVNYITPATPINFSAVDPLVADVASGLQRIEVSVDGEPFAPRIAPLTLAEGRHTVLYRAVDNVGNIEATRTLSVQSDATAPVSAAEVGSPSFTAADGTRYVTPATPVTFSSADPLAADVASGLDRIEVNIDSAGYVSYSGPLFFAEGRHTMLFRAVDKVGNVETARTLTVQSDATPPLTTLAASGDFFVSEARNFAPASFSYSLSAQDPIVSQVASGVAFTRFGTGGGLQTYSSAFSLSEGVRAVEFQSQDNVGNLESLKTETVHVDATAPTSSLSVGAPSFDPGGGQPVFVAPATLLSLAAVDPMSGGVASGLRLISFRRGSDAFTTYTSSFGLAVPDGLKTVEFFAEDNVANRETAESRTFALDGAAPATSLAVQGGRQHPGPDAASFYASAGTRFDLVAVDPVVNGVAAGIAFTRFQDNAGTLQNFGSAFSLAEGSHVVAYQSQDNVQNLEVLRSTTVLIDATAPVTSVQIGAPLYAAPDGTNYVAPGTPVAFTAADPVVQGVASGVNRIEVAVDGGSFVAYSSALTFAEGRHTVQYRAFDNVGNAEAARTLNVQSDDTAPLTALGLIGGRQFPGPNAASFFASSDTRLSLPAADPAISNVASGVTFTRWQDNGGVFQTFNAPITLLEGSHALGYQSRDNVENLEVLRSTTVLVDATAPVSSATIGSPLFLAAGGARFITPATPVAFSAADPAVNGVASGVQRIETSIDGGPYALYTAALTFGEGAHSVLFRAVDNVGNTELARTLTVQSDDTPPVTTAETGEPLFVAPDGTNYITPATPVTFRAVDPTVGTVASGVSRTEVAVDGGPFAAYSGALTFAEGRHTILFRSIDTVGNIEIAQTLSVQSDDTTPLTSLAVLDGRQFPGPNAATFYASPETRFGLPAVDPVASDVASGLAFTQWQDNGGAYQAFTAAFALPEGSHMLAYQSQDNVSNLEVPRSTTVLVDATAPVSTASIATPRFIAADGTIYLTPETPITLSAADPSLPAGQPGSGVSRIEVAIDGEAFSPYGAALTVAEGLHTILFKAVDNVANVETVHTLLVRSDATTPQTALTLAGGRQAAGSGVNSFYASADTSFSLPAADPVVNGVASGIALTRYQDNGGPFQNFASVFQLAEGSHALGYQSQDNVGHLEVLRSTTVLVDATAPVSAAAIGSPLFVGADGTNYVTPATPVTFSALDPVSNGVASGVDRIEVAIDGGAFAPYASALTFPEGRHTVLFRALDRVGNVEATHRLDLQSDDTRPATAFMPSGALFTEGGRSYAPAQFTYALPAQDPEINNVASGVAFTRYRTGQGAYLNFVSTFSLSEGIRRVEFQSQDNVGNLELLTNATVFVDATLPVSALAVGNPKFDPGNGQPVFVAAATPLTLSAQDPVLQEVASGVRRVSFRRGTDAFGTYAGPFTLPLPDGFKTVDFFAADNVDNTEATRSATLALDNTAPATVLAVLGGRQFAGPDAASFYASSDTRFSLPAADPVTGGVASGLALTQYQDNGGAFQVFASAFGLPEGAHLLAYQSQDNVSNLEVPRSTTVLIDATAPVSSATVAAPQFIASDGTVYITPATPVTLSAVDPALPTGQPGSAVSRIEVAIDGGPLTVYSAALTFAEGRHTILYRAVDNVANVEAIRTLNVQSDATQPHTELAVIDGKQASSPLSGTFYASFDTRYALPAADPIVNDVASDVAFTRYQDNGGALLTFTAPIALSEGSHLFAYQSQDNVQNLEVLRSTTVLVDATAPVSSATIGSPFFVGADGTRYITPATPVTLSAFDLVVNAVASGVDRIEVAIDGGAFAAYASALTFPEGRHTVLFRALDRVGNVSATSRLDLRSDHTPPITSFTPSGAFFTEGGRSYAPAQFTYALPAQDPEINNVASGVAFTRYRTGQGAYQNFVSPFSLSEGVRRVEFQSQDNIGNLELLKSATVFVDATVPDSALAIGSPQFDPGDGRPVFVAAATPLTLSAQDPEVQEVASGVRQISFRRGGDAFGAYAAPLTLPLPDGLKTLDYFAADNVGNVEVARSTSLALDNTAPATALAVLGGRQFPGPNATSFYASSDTRLALPAVDPTVNGVASGLALTQWRDNGGAFQTFTAAFALPEGAHAVGYQSQDRVLNMEVLRSTSVLVDATPPVTTAHIGAPWFAAADGTNYITPATPVTFTAVDPAVSGVASGVHRIEVAVDGGPFTAYSSALTFAEGRHTILYRAIDNVANVEAILTLNIQSDATQPASALAIGAPKFDPGQGQPVIVAAATLMTLSAQDPVVLNVASGVRQISFRRGGDPFGTYAAPFTLPLSDGLKTLDYFATDNVGNVEVTRSTMVALDDTSPLTTLAVLGGRQFPGPDATSFYASSDTRLALPAADPVVNGVASGLAFTQWQDNGGAFQAFAGAFGLPEGAHLIAYQSQDRVQNMEVPRSTTVFADATAPVSSATIDSPLFVAADGTNYITPATPVKLSAVDPTLPTGQLGSGVSRIEVSINGGPFTVYSAALTFAEGRHTILYRAVDNVANVETLRTLQVRSDATPPVSSLIVGQPQFQLPTGLLVSTRTPFSTNAVDPIISDVASGVKDTFYRVSDLAPGGAAFQTFSTPFSMAGLDANKVIEFYSRDNVLNTEAIKSSTVLLDSTPPEVALLSPASCDSGVCRVLKGKFPVLGTAQDRHFHTYTLEFAPGKDASAGFALISSGTVAVSSGTLGVWDASTLGGWQTLRLSANDLVQNGSVLALNVFVGDPATVLVLGGHDTFNMPEGVAVGGDGKIYVADRNNDRVAVFSSTGAALASFGGRGRNDEANDDHPRPSTSTLRLKRPAAVAVDAAGSIFVADTGNHRVLKLSPAGQVMLDIGRRKIEGGDDQNKAERKVEFTAGAGPAEFKSPSGIAVDAAGNIYVSDTDNHRVQVFSSTGIFTLAFDLPAAPEAPEGDDERGAKDDDDERPRLGKPVGIALDLAANIYVADSKGRRALAFDATGRLLMTVPVLGLKGRGAARPVGIAVTPSGKCLLVSDQQSGRILKYDFQGNLNLAFGGKRRGEAGERRSVSSIKLRKPTGLAMDAEGALYVADRNDVRIKKFSLPDGSATVFAPAQGPEDDNIAREVIDREDGGLVERKDRAAVSIPPDALPEDLRISVSTPTAAVADESRRGADDKNMKVASPPVEFQPHGAEFDKPVTLTIPYNPELLAAQNAADADLRVHYWNPKTKAWEELDSTVDKQSLTVTAKTTHFSLYQVYTGTDTSTAAAPLAADASFGVKAAYAFPNPARGVGAVTIRIQPGLADSVQVNVYDVAGRKVHSSSNFRNLGAFDDGNGLGAQFTYEHVWDLSGIGSGVYAYVITAQKSGERDIHRSGKIGVVK
ncbi:MAG: hypothetical protein HYV14_00350 [Elusimicrobia bacterium]|nr:hypothetical protein [Elusimicrobiota bacterium]